MGALLFFFPFFLNAISSFFRLQFCIKYPGFILNNSIENDSIQGYSKYINNYKNLELNFIL